MVGDGGIDFLYITLCHKHFGPKHLKRSKRDLWVLLCNRQHVTCVSVLSLIGLFDLFSSNKAFQLGSEEFNERKVGMRDK